MVVGVLYWALWRVVPRWFGYDFIPRKEKLSDGTVVTVVRLSLAPSRPPPSESRGFVLMSGFAPCSSRRKSWTS